MYNLMVVAMTASVVSILLVYQFDRYTFTAHVDDLHTIARHQAIHIETDALADFDLDKDHKLRIVGFVGGEEVGKTWLINRIFGTHLRTGTAKNNYHGLRVLHAQHGGDSWLVVNALGSNRRPEGVDMAINLSQGLEKKWKQQLVYQQLQEMLRNMIMEELCDALVVVVDDTKFDLNRVNPYVRVASMIERGSVKKIQPVTLIAHNLRDVATIEDAKANFQAARRNLEETTYIQRNTSGYTTLREEVRVKTSGNLEGGAMSFKAAFPMGDSETSVLNFGFAKAGSEAGDRLNAESGEHMLKTLNAVVPRASTVNVLEALRRSTQNSLHHVLQGKINVVDEFADFAKGAITVSVEKDLPNYVFKINGMTYLRTKENFMEALNGTLLVQDIENPPEQNFTILDDAIDTDTSSGRKTRTLQLRLPRIKPNDVKIIEESDQVFIEVTERSRRGIHGGLVTRPVDYTGRHQTVFRSGTSRMRLPLGGWSIDLRDPAATKLEYGIYTIRATQLLVQSNQATQ
jgi:hypothetical protein